MEEVFAALDAMLALTVGRDLIAAGEVADAVLDIRQALLRTLEPA